MAARRPSAELEQEYGSYDDDDEEEEQTARLERAARSAIRAQLLLAATPQHIQLAKRRVRSILQCCRAGCVQDDLRSFCSPSCSWVKNASPTAAS